MDANDEITASKKRLALELLELLRQSRPAPSLDSFEMSETVAQNHQKRDNRRFNYPPLRVLIGNKTYTTIDWSLGGLMIGDYDGDLKLHERFKLAMSDGAPGGVYFASEGRVTRVDKKAAKLGLQFMTLSKGGVEWLSRLQLLQRSKRKPADKNGAPAPAVGAAAR
jgi:hypothetical protein